MRIRVPSGALRGAISGLAIVIAAASLAGCSSLGSRLLPGNDGMVTGSTGPASQANLNQQMPSRLSPLASSSGRYLPPADIGSSGDAGPFYTASTVPPAAVGQGGVQSVRSQDLPALTSSGSNQSMPAQLSPKPVTVAAAQPAPISRPQSLPQTQPSVPAVARAPERPALRSVPDDAYMHQIASGESLYTISRKYGVGTDAIITANALPSADRIFVGQKLIIPGMRAPANEASDDVTTGAVATAPVQSPATVPQPPKQEAPAQVAVAKPVVPQADSTPSVSDKFRWPVNGTVIADFSTSKNGINISVQEGTAVRAAEAGEVLYVGNAVQGYGNLILIRHANGYVSAYAHLKEITVAKGDTVGRGDAVGTAGMTGSVDRPQLHFELRKGAAPVDPMPLLAS